MKLIEWIGTLLVVGFLLVSCHYPEPDYSVWNLTREQRDSLEFRSTHHYGVNYNFKVLADSLPLREMLSADSLWVRRGDVLVVADFARMTSDTVHAVWIKVARDQHTMGWVPEERLLESVVPVDPISQFIHWFSSLRNRVFLFIGCAFLGTGLILFLSALGGYFIVRRSFRPADRAVEAAGQIVTSNDLSKRIGLGNGDDEIHSMTKAFDAMLDRLEEAFRKEKQFTSDASHELRTPLSVIKAECEYASKHVDDPEKMRQALSSIDRQAGRMTSLVSELLSLARADKGTLSPKYEDFCLSELGEMVLDSFEEEAEKKGLKLIAKCEDGLCVQADQGMVTRVLINLISNAVQYTGQGGWVMLRTERDGDWALISVEDNGIGIDEANLERIWDRFFQVDPSRSSSSSGAGLGLPIVKAIIEAHKGSVSVESQPGKGSTFTVRIPLVKVE